MSSLISFRTFILFLGLLEIIMVTATTTFDFNTLTPTSLKFVGDAHVFKTSVRLTRDLPVPNTGAGMVLYDKPVRFHCPMNETRFIFTTFFSFTIVNINPDSSGGGLAFVISPTDEAIGDAGGYLGIPTGAVAVEFDTLMDVGFKDVNGNHVGLDLNSMVSTQSVNLDSVNVNLKSGNLVNAWVEYSGDTQQLNIFISHDKPKPKSPVLSIFINLNEYLNEYMFVGFTGSTQGSTEIHSIEWWSFTSCADGEQQASPVPPPPPPQPTKTTSTNPAPHVYKPPPFSMLSANRYKPKTKKKSKGCKQCGWAFGFISVSAAAVLGISWKIGTININCINSCFNRYYYKE